jgi:hypothetical protein
MKTRPLSTHVNGHSLSSRIEGNGTSTLDLDQLGASSLFPSQILTERTPGEPSHPRLKIVILVLSITSSWG